MNKASRVPGPGNLNNLSVYQWVSITVLTVAQWSLLESLILIIKHPMPQCECKDPYHKGESCHREAADHMQGWPGGVVSSPQLCMACLFGCEDFNGV